MRRLIGSAMLLTLAACTTPDDTPTPTPTPSAQSQAPTQSASPTPSPSVQPSPTPTPTPSAAASPAPKPELDAALLKAAWDDDVAAATELIGQGADVNAKDDTQQSAYLVATSEGYLDLLRLTLANGAVVDDKDSWNGTGLIRAAERGHFLVVGELLRAGIDRDHVNRIGYQAIHEAIWLGKDNQAYATTLRVLVAGGVELDRPSGQEGLAPLQMAREKGFQPQEALLVASAGGGDMVDPDTTLIEAAQDGEADLVALALRAGADLEAKDAAGRTALLHAVTEDHVAVADLLVAMGASPDTLDDQHDTPWLVTGVTGSVDMLESLLPANPDLTIRNRFGGLSVIPASERGHADYVRRVVQTDIDVNHVNDLGWTALLEAVILGDGSGKYVDIVTTLLGAGADPSIADKNGVTALEHGRDKGFDEIAEVLAAGF